MPISVVTHTLGVEPFPSGVIIANTTSLSAIRLAIFSALRDATDGGQRSIHPPAVISSPAQRRSTLLTPSYRFCVSYQRNAKEITNSESWVLSFACQLSYAF